MQHFPEISDRAGSHQRLYHDKQTRNQWHHAPGNSSQDRPGRPTAEQKHGGRSERPANQGQRPQLKTKHAGADQQQPCDADPIDRE